jgi:uncharacterized protein
MKKLLLGLLSLCLVACEAQEPKPGDGCVWKVSDADSAFYLCGTIHLLRKEDHPLPAAYDQAYEDSIRLFFELPPGDGRDAELAALMQKKGQVPEGKALSDMLPGGIWDALTQWTQKRGLSAANFNGYQPWFVALLVMTTEFQTLGADASRGVEPVFEKQALRDQKPTEGLETLDFQVGLFADLTAEQQNDLLQQTLNEVQTVEQSFADLITAWRTGDVEELYKLLSAEAEKYPVLIDLFLHQRNTRWVKQLSAELQKPGNFMVLVGAGHLGGTKGVLAGLRAQGYKIERVLKK